MQRGKTVSADNLDQQPAADEKATFAQAEALYNEEMQKIQNWKQPSII